MFERLLQAGHPSEVVSRPEHYRPEIDGLRALAVVAVVLYHFGIPGWAGGFVGVDVFFVLSGFLIGGILWREQGKTGRIALGRFFARRFRRLMPAYFVMALLSTVVAVALLLPFDLVEHGGSLAASTVYLANVWFYTSTGYFDVGAEDRVLLHTWSLSVEEQFYLFLPLMLVALGRWRRARAPALLLCWAASLVACVWVTQRNQPAAFYLFHLRAWEMLTGVLLAIWGAERQASWRGGSALSWLGLATIVASVMLTRPEAAFPGLIAAAPVAGTAMVLANGRDDNGVNRLLSRSGPMFFGVISYSLYLWHLPIEALATYLRDGPLGPVESAMGIGLSCVLAWASWRYVELPARWAGHVSDRAVFAWAASATSLLLALGAVIHVGGGWPERYGPLVRPHVAASMDFEQDWSRCHEPTEGPLRGVQVCPIGPDREPQVVVWGDSHVRAVVGGLALLAEETDTPGIVLWRPGCPPLHGLRKVENSATRVEDEACVQDTVRIEQALGQISSVRSVILVARWAYYLTGQGVGLDEFVRIDVHPREGTRPVGVAQASLVGDAMVRTARELSSQVDEVYILRQVPEISDYSSRRAARALAHRGLPLAGNRTARWEVPRAEAEHRSQDADVAWGALASEGVVTYLDPWPWLCDETRCSALHDNVGWYFDNNHLTTTAARAIREVFRPAFVDGRSTRGEP